MRGHDELELKLLVPSDFRVPASLDAGEPVKVVDGGPPLDLTATYFDTPDMALLNHGITFRHRSGEDEGPLWTLKLPVSNDAALRKEIECAGPGGVPPQRLQDLLFGVLAGVALEPVAEIKTRRWRRSLIGEANMELAELVDDRVSVLEGSVIRHSYREIEIESRGAGLDQLQKIADAVEGAGGEPDQRSKLARALEALNRNGSLADEGPAFPSPNDPAHAAIGPALAAALHRFVTNDPYARLGEVEGIHQLRVAARRLRSVIRTFAPLIPEQRLAPIVEELQATGHALGAVRDLDVMIEEIAKQAAGAEDVLAPVIATLSARREAAMVGATNKLTSPEYVELIQAIEKLAGETEWPVGEVSGSIEEVLPDIVQRAWRKMRNAARALTHESPEAEFHRARILAKRARYAAETVAPFTKEKQSDDIRAFAVVAERVQNVLGEHQDAAVARDTLAALAEQFPDDARLNFWLGRIVEREDQRAHERRKQFFDAWSRVVGKKQNKWPNSS